VGPYVIDFYCPALKLAIEIDGESHTGAAQAYDRERQRYIERYGIRFLRYSNTDVYGNLDGVLGDIYKAIRDFTTSDI
jgi:very-short-patch-repair endonuclease